MATTSQWPQIGFLEPVWKFLGLFFTSHLRPLLVGRRDGGTIARIVSCVWWIWGALFRRKTGSVTLQVF